MPKACYGKYGKYAYSDTECQVCSDRDECKAKSLRPYKTEVQAKITLWGFKLEGETEEQTKARVVLEAEQRINEVPDIRAHIE